MAVEADGGQGGGVSGGVNATARVQVTLEFSVGSWGADCATGQVFRQAASDVVSQLERLLAHKCKEGVSPPRASLVGKPRVLCVIVPESD